MPTPITIPLSTFELAITYEKPNIRLLADRAEPLQAVLDAFAPWNPRLDDMEILTLGKHSEQGVKIKINSQGASFFFGALGCRFTQEGADWDQADNIVLLITTAMDALAAATGVRFGAKVSVITLHLQPETVASKDILRNMMVPGILGLAKEPTSAMAIVARWPKRRITIDGSAALANAIFLQAEREFDPTVTFEDIGQILLSDQEDLFTLLGVEEVRP